MGDNFELIVFLTENIEKLQQNEKQKKLNKTLKRKVKAGLKDYFVLRKLVFVTKGLINNSIVKMKVRVN